MYKQLFHDNIQYFFALYRKLAIESEMYPYIGYNDIKKFCYNLNIITSWATPMVTIGEDEEDGKTFLARLEGD